ncbi:glutamyl-tRNA synthetase [Parabacteroides sp. PFB2-12]|uniref:glutamate--tRNA ligase n=1 Tax=unclassified Parabacteroides TaxID=2649774 RepID=UPI002476DCA1|nr:MULTISPECIES: glutamate--tRNA ligase [unclassified Parabacteroides]MDH6342625.1 glutamyl-tRNA synthetase [Parabacteroides sp. PM6-13]MDH6391753.1 glutamyl-tRNA synthetase [Parabacteroides sp. PFB2-12]
MKLQKVRVRFAPSPTGPLHIGGVRTALYNYLFAKQHDGDFLLRIEDTDSQRFVPGAEDYIIEALTWLGLRFDEGVGFGGDKGPYRQSERKEIYRQYVDQLLNQGLAYMAFDTPEELDVKRNEIANFQYDASTRGLMRNSLTLSQEVVDSLLAEGAQYVVRIKIEPGEEVKVNDLIRGEVIVNSSVLDDKVLFKSADQLPTYHLANIVDDHLMEITHVIRGEEWLPSAPLHVLLYRYLGWEESMPQFAHLSLLLKPDGKGKLSKRDGDRLGFPVFPLEWKDPKTGEISSGYRESGYLPEAVVNFLALLGWNPGNDQEMMAMEEMIRLFDLTHCSRSGAKFDIEKGKWFNHQYLQKKENKEIAELFIPVLKEHGIENIDPLYVEKIAGLMKERVNFVKELWETSAFFFKAPDSYDEKTVKKRWKEDSAAQLTELIEVLRTREPFDSAGTEEEVKAWIENKGYHLGNIMNATRLALVGEGKGPHIFDITEALGKEETINRLEKAIQELN